ncbi:MAG: sodium:proton exchanger [Gammaproteobacteria bacterium HGW-Gammaproteobacteria-8]|nr:MAG: sodium:proton exchanger [Gammaproteobacteria bacterium HGW-Gammaproteobacteria-8]
MNADHPASLVVLILATGLASQWIAWRLRLPGIVILIGAGLLLGPVFGVLDFQTSSEHLTELIGLGVAIILFEGGMDLKLGELKKSGKGVGRLVLLGAPITWLLTALAAHFIIGLSWPVAIVLGAILVVTGPTVILPILRYARLEQRSTALLKWEGIVNDPIGVLLAVLSFQYFTNIGETFGDSALALGSAVLVALVLGGAGGWMIARLYARGGVPEHLKPPILMVLVLLAFKLSNVVQHEAGLLTVTLMGMVFGNARLAGREDLQRFKENLTIVLVSVLFVVITARLEFDQLLLLDARALLFIAAVLFLIRPISVGLATAGAGMRGSERALLAWIAPRGIVAAATAGLFGPAMVEAGYADASILLPLVFAIIIATVLAHGLTLGPVGRKLGLAADDDNGVLIVGASPWSLELARSLRAGEVEVVMVDGVYRRLREARMENVPVHYGEILSKHAEETLETHHIGLLLAATPNDFYNALVCNALGKRFGRHRSLQLATSEASRKEERRLTSDQRGHLAFSDSADYDWLHQRLDEGWTIQRTRLGKQFTLADLSERLGEPGTDWLPIATISPTGRPRLYTRELPFAPEHNALLLYFSLKNKDAQDQPAAQADSSRNETEPSEDTSAT